MSSNFLEQMPAKARELFDMMYADYDKIPDFLKPSDEEIKMVIDSIDPNAFNAVSKVLYMADNLDDVICNVDRLSDQTNDAHIKVAGKFSDKHNEALAYCNVDEVPAFAIPIDTVDLLDTDTLTLQEVKELKQSAILSHLDTESYETTIIQEKMVNSVIQADVPINYDLPAIAKYDVIDLDMTEDILDKHSRHVELYGQESEISGLMISEPRKECSNKEHFLQYVAENDNSKGKFIFNPETSRGKTKTNIDRLLRTLDAANNFLTCYDPADKDWTFSPDDFNNKYYPIISPSAVNNVIIDILKSTTYYAICELDDILGKNSDKTRAFRLTYYASSSTHIDIHAPSILETLISNVEDQRIARLYKKLNIFKSMSDDMYEAACKAILEDIALMRVILIRRILPQRYSKLLDKLVYFNLGRMINYFIIKDSVVSMYTSIEKGIDLFEDPLEDIVEKNVKLFDDNIVACSVKPPSLQDIVDAGYSLIQYDGNLIQVSGNRILLPKISSQDLLLMNTFEDNIKCRRSRAVLQTVLHMTSDAKSREIYSNLFGTSIETLNFLHTNNYLETTCLPQDIVHLSMSFRSIRASFTLALYNAYKTNPFVVLPTIVSAMTSILNLILIIATMPKQVSG